MEISIKEEQTHDVLQLEATFENVPKYSQVILQKLINLEKLLTETDQPQQPDELFSEFVPKGEVRGKFASSSTLWQWEKQGKIKSYGIGGKRFYKRSELEDLIQPIKTEGAEK